MADAARAQRQKALEEKKKRLEELKARREQRATSSVSATEAARATISASSNLETYIDGLLNVPGTAVARPDDSGTRENGGSSSHAPTQTDAGASQPATSAAAAAISGDSSGSSSNAGSQSVAAIPHHAVPAVKKETFEMGTQTAADDFDESETEKDPQQPLSAATNEETSSQDAGLKATEDISESEEDDGDDAPKVLTTEEVEKELTSEAFSSFLNIASKKVERALGSDLLANLLVDYDGGSSNDKHRDAGGKSDGSRFLGSRQIYECPNWTASRDVTDMDWSPLHRELMLCGYHMPSSSANLGQPTGSSAVRVVSPDDTPSDSLAPRNGELLSDGLALVWNLAMPHRPEHIFTCGSPVTKVRFHPNEATLIIGGCQSGQVVVWDIRAGRMPVQKSVLTTTQTGNSKGHTHPICAMEVIEGGAGLVTASTDGRVNFWSLANLRDPIESVQIGDSVSCLAVSPESGNLICGDDMGAIYTIQSPNNASIGQRSRKQVRKLDCGDADGGHFGMVTSVATKAQKSAKAAGLSKGFLRGAGGLFLSSGVDWTVKLWAPAYTDKSLLSLVSHSYDYMSDVQWNPAHPALVATASSNGTIGLWNFSHSLEEPITGADGIVVEPDGGSGRGLNKLKWSSDGRRLLAASADRVHVLVLSEDVVRQKGDEESRMMNHLTSRGLLDRE